MEIILLYIVVNMMTMVMFEKLVKMDKIHTAI